MSQKPHEYTACPIMFSATCKKEDGVQHARLLSTAIKAVHNTKTRDGRVRRLVSVTSDGESK